MIRLKRALRRARARSWWLSSAWYRLHGLRLLGRPQDEVWYFAYGSNMHDKTFRGWRRMRPSEWRPALIRGYRLRFNLEGRPRGRAAPANLAPDPAAEVWGVLYKIQRRHLIWLDCTEGIPLSPYRHLWIEAEDREGNRVFCVTYMAKSEEKDGRPSLRYLRLLRDGARAHGLPEEWVRFLESVEHADRRRVIGGSRATQTVAKTLKPMNDPRWVPFQPKARKPVPCTASPGPACCSYWN